MKYTQSKGNRIKRYGVGVDITDDINNPDYKFYYWVYDLGRFVCRSEIPKGKSYCSHAPCRTVRRFRKICKAHKHLKGRLRFCSRYVGHDIYG